MSTWSAWRERLLDSAAGPYWYRLWEWRRSLDPRLRRGDADRAGRRAPDGLPLPPPRLVVGIGAAPSLDWYVDSGERDAARLRGALDSAGAVPGPDDRILDFGCGCGRLTRHLVSWTRGAVVGSDHDRAAVRWCRRHLPGARFVTNGLAPPLGLDTGGFDLAVAFSVFTHLDTALAERWLAELARVLARGGRLVLTSHGAAYREHLSPVERARFDAGEIVVRRPRAAGSNLCAAFHPAPALRAVLARHFEVIRHETGSEHAGEWQDVWVGVRPHGV